jgi:RNA polymerase sigma factor for flagellar operon FliA
MDQDLQPLVEEYLDDPTESNKEAVVMAALPLVRSIIGKISVPDHLLAEHEDLENVGIVGLLEALDNYDPEKARFATHAYRRVHGSVIDYLRSIDVLSRGQRKKIGALQETISTLRQMMGEEPSDKDIADYMGLSLESYHQLLRDAQRRFSLSLSDPINGEDQTMADVLPDDTAQENFERFEKESTQKYLQSLIETLPERQQTILGLYYTEDLTLSEIGEVIDLSVARVSQILGKIRVTLESKIEEHAH